MPETPTIEQVENRIKASQDETQRLIKQQFDAIPDAVKGAIERARAKDALPGRVPQVSARPDGTTTAGWSVEDAGIEARLKRGYDVDLPAAIGGGKLRKLRMIKDFYRYGPAARAYAESSGDQSFRGFADYLKAVAGAIPKTGFRGVDTLLKASLAEGGGDTGGFLTPTQYSFDIKALEIEGAQFEPLATTIPMNTLRLLMPTIRDTTHGAGGPGGGISVYGGVAAQWAPEAGALTEVEPLFGQLQLEAHKLTLYTVASNELVNDSAVALEALIRQRFPDAAVWFKEDSFWRGTGGGMPVGVVNAPALYTQAKETGQPASTVVVENVINMYSRMLPTSHKRAAWFCHPQVLPQLATMALSVGTGGAPIFLNVYTGGIQNDYPYTIFGRPLYVTEHLPALGSAGQLIYADLSYYLIGMRQDLSFEASQHVKFVNDQTVWRMIERLDGRPWIDSALTLRDGSFSVSPFVALAA